MEKIKLSNGKVVSKKDYVKLKTKDLIEFGYKTLTEQDVAEQLERILNKEELNVIGMFMEYDIEVNPQDKD